MRRFMILAAALAFVPVAAEAQVIGIDGGLGIVIPDAGDNTIAFTVPNSMLRIDFGGDDFSFETMFSLAIVSNDGTATLIRLAPGVNFPMGEDGMYLRGQVPMAIISGGGSTDTEFGLGGAIGTLRPINDGPVSLRLEGGVDFWFGDADFTEIRGVVGLAVDVG